MSREEVAEAIARYARAGESWALRWIGDRYWPKFAKLELGGEVEVQTYHGSFRDPFLNSEEARDALREVSEEAVDH